MYDLGALAPSIQIQQFVQQAFSLANFLFLSKVFCRIKTGEVEVDSYLTLVQ